MSFWRHPQPLILASKSAIRRQLLERAGLPVEIVPAEVDERGLEQAAGPLPPPEVAALLADAKARTVATGRPGRIIVAADQTLSCQGCIFSKPEGRDGARTQLATLRGRPHELHAAVAVFSGGRIAFRHVATARLTMRPFSDAFLEAYLDQMGEVACASVGGYQLEGLGVQLFDRVEGDYFTILGLPLLPLLGFLRQSGALQA
jgi:septum formation protein